MQQCTQPIIFKRSPSQCTTSATSSLLHIISQYSTPRQVHEHFEGQVGAVGGVPVSHFQRQNALILTRQEVARGDL